MEDSLDNLNYNCSMYDEQKASSDTHYPSCMDTKDKTSNRKLIESLSITDYANEQRKLPKEINIVVPKAKRYLVACAIVKDEIDLSEWVAYQFAVGFDHVHIYDNESTKPVTEILHNWIADRKVSVEVVRGRKQQCVCYSAFLKKAESKWVAFIDVDEFVLPHQVDDIKLLLERYEAFGGLCVTWKVFGSSGVIAHSKELVIETYTKTSAGFFDVTPNSKERWPQYKTIAQPEFTTSFPNPHFARYHAGCYAINEQKRQMPRWHSHGPASLRTVQINHYFVKSAEDFKAKQERRGPNSDRSRTTGEWDHVERWCNAKTDARIQRFAPKVRLMLAEYK